MEGRKPDRIEVERFLREKIDSVPHLEALLLLWSSRKKGWEADDLGARLYVDHYLAERILQNLAQLQLIANAGDQFWYERGSKSRDEMVERVNSLYRQETVRIAKLVHDKTSLGNRRLARSQKES
jgi:hypothetical protein